MLIVAGYAKLAPADIDRLEAAGRAMAAESVKEKGCREYCFARDISNPGVVRIFEIWDDQAALDAHMATPHMAEFQKAMASAAVEDSSVAIYDVSGTRPITGG